MVFSLVRYTAPLEISNPNLEGSRDVDTTGVCIAAPVVREALVDVHALDSVTDEPFLARTSVGTLGVATVGKFAARVGVKHALVVVGASFSRAVRFHGVSLLASAIERTDSVVAFAVATDVWLRYALVDV